MNKSTHRQKLLTKLKVIWEILRLCFPRCTHMSFVPLLSKKTVKFKMQEFDMTPSIAMHHWLHNLKLTLCWCRPNGMSETCHKTCLWQLEAGHANASIYVSLPPLDPNPASAWRGLIPGLSSLTCTAQICASNFADVDPSSSIGVARLNMGGKGKYPLISKLHSIFPYLEEVICDCLLHSPGVAHTLQRCGCISRGWVGSRAFR